MTIRTNTIFALLCLVMSCSKVPSKTKPEVSRATASTQINFERLDKGVPITQVERQHATDRLIAILKKTSYFDYVDSRVHGIPESDSSKPYWWGTMWTGVKVKKLNGKVTYTHGETGSDNAGIQTAPYLEGACFAYLLTGDQKYAHLARKLMRGMSAWILSSSRSASDSPKILSRAFYPASIHSTDGGRDLDINYDLNRPGKNGVPSGYVHIPNNPLFGDIWVKNNRSVDDIGHILRAIAQVQACGDAFDNETKIDLKRMTGLYKNWAESVDTNNFNIPLYNFNAEIVSKKNGLGDYNAYHFLDFDPTCVEKIAIRYMHTGNAGDLKCKKGISFLELIGDHFLQNDAIEILRSHHIAAVALAQLKSQTEVAEKLMEGLQERMDRDYRVLMNPKVSPKFDLQDIPTFFVHANNVGVPMTSDEIRYLYGRLDIAYNGMLDPAHYNTFHLFDSSVPDGEYRYDPPHIGLYFYTLGAMIGSCTSNFLSPSTNARPLFDCDRLKKGLIKN